MSFKKTVTIVLTVIFTVISLTACSVAKTTDNNNTALDLNQLFTSRDFESDYNEDEAKVMTLTNSNSRVTIDDEGVYVITGTCDDGQITVNANDTDKVQLVLSNLSLTAKNTAAIYVKKADKVFITTADGTTNTLESTGEFTSSDDTNIDGVIFSKDDITLNGTGTLTVIAENGNGIVSKDDLKITDGSYELTVSNKGIEANDSVRIGGGEITVNALNDAVHSDGDVAIIDGTLKINSEDDAVHADGVTYILGGTIQIENCYEAIEGTKIYISNGTINGYASDDGINASSAKDSEDANDGRMGSFGMDEVDEDALISISGGNIQLNTEGDGIDSNGNLEITGGDIVINGPTNNGNAALDYNGTASISGGTLIAIGMSGMAQNMSEATQGSLLINFNATYSGTVNVSDAEGNTLLTFDTEKTFNSLVISTPQLEKGNTYTVSIGDTYQTVTLDDYVYGNSAGFGMMH